MDPLEALAHIVRIEAINAARDAHQERAARLDRDVENIVKRTSSESFNVVRKELSRVRKLALAFADQNDFSTEDGSSSSATRHCEDGE